MNISRLLDIIRYDTNLIFWKLIDELKKFGMNPIYEFDNWIYVDNSNPIMLIAHIDTITRSKKLKFKVRHNYIKARNSVLGADDRAGVYGILEVLNLCKLNSVPMPSILFTNYEESGLLGVRSFIKSNVMKRNINLFIELDRKGKNDYVYYDYRIPEQIRNYVESYGYVEKFGSFSDVAELTEEYLIPHINLSVGYYNQHMSTEYLVPSELNDTINNVFDMVKNPIDELYTVELCNYYNYYNPYIINKYDGMDYGLNPLAFIYYPDLDLLIENECSVEESDIAWSDEELYQYWEGINNEYYQR